MSMTATDHCAECENCSLSTKLLVWLARQSNTIQYAVKIGLYFVIFWILGMLLIAILHRGNNYEFSKIITQTHVNPIYFGFVGAIWETLKIFVYNSISMPPTFMPKTNSVLIVLTSKSIPRSKNIIDLSLCDYPGENVFIHEFKNEKDPVKSIECLMEFIRAFIETKLTVNIAYYKLYNTAFAFIVGRMMYLRGYDHKVYHRWGCIFYSQSRDQEYQKSRNLNEIINIIRNNFSLNVEIIGNEHFEEKISQDKIYSIQDLSKEIIKILDKTGGYSEKTMILLDATMTELSREALYELLKKDIVEKIIILKAKLESHSYSRDKLCSQEILSLAILFEHILDDIYNRYSSHNSNGIPINVAFKTPSAVAHYIGHNASHVNYRVFMFDVNSGKYTIIYNIKGREITPKKIE